MSEYCRKIFLFLSYLVATVGSIAYCFYLIWLLAYVKDNANYWFFAFIPGIVLVYCLIRVSSKQLFSRMFPRLLTGFLDPTLNLIFLAVGYQIIMMMCTFTLLTRQAYYHLSSDDLIGPKWVIMSLKASIVFFISGFLAMKECRFQKILEEKDILSRVLLDFVDIFNLIELLSLNKCVGIGSFVTEGSSLEMAIQAFCTTWFLIISSVIQPPTLQNQHFGKMLHVIYTASPIYQNLPFLVIRIIVSARHGVFSLGFMVKNIWAIVVCCGEIFTKSPAADDGEPNNFRVVTNNEDDDGDDDDGGVKI